jgi:hypothetical protein
MIAFVAVCFMVQLIASLSHSDELMFDPIDSDDYACFEQGLTANSGFNVLTPKNYNHSLSFNAEQNGNFKVIKVKYMVPYVLNPQESEKAIFSVKKARFAEISKCYTSAFFHEINPPPPKYC